MAIHGQQGHATAAKVLLTVLHVFSIVAAAWILLEGEAGVRQEATPGSAGVDQAVQAMTLIAFAVIYLARLSLGGSVFLSRGMGWAEALTVGLLLLVVHPLFAALALHSTPSDLPLWWTAVLLYGLGSFLNSWSEYQRYRFKQRQPNALYTGGLFRLVRHPNYLGDTLLFTGYALATGSLWALIVPALMALGFVLLHIPKLDRHLDAKYGAEYRAWAARTARFVPGVY